MTYEYTSETLRESRKREEQLLFLRLFGNPTFAGPQFGSTPNARTITNPFVYIFRLIFFLEREDISAPH